MDNPIIQMIVISAVCGLIAAVIACVIVVVKYKKKLKSPIYPVDDFCSLSLVDSRDDYIGSTITKVRISSSSRKR